MSSTPIINPAFIPKPSLKPRHGRSWKRLKRIEIAAQLEAQFVSDNEIANHLGITVQALHHIKICPEFLALRLQLKTNILSIYTQNRLDSEEAQKEEIQNLVPMALGAVKRILSDATHPAYGKMAQDILDRNRATAKISRMEHAIAPPTDINKENLQAQELLHMLEASSTPGPYSAPVQITGSGPSIDDDPISGKVQ